MCVSASVGGQCLCVVILGDCSNQIGEGEGVGGGCGWGRGGEGVNQSLFVSGLMRGDEGR